MLAFVFVLAATTLLMGFFLWHAHRQATKAVEVAMGNRLYNTVPIVPMFSVAARAYFRELKQDPKLPIYISESITGKKAYEPVVVIARPLPDAQGRFMGVVVGALKMRYFIELFKPGTAIR